MKSKYLTSKLCSPCQFLGFKIKIFVYISQVINRFYCKVIPSQLRINKTYSRVMRVYITFKKTLYTCQDKLKFNLYPVERRQFRHDIKFHGSFLKLN